MRTNNFIRFMALTAIMSSFAFTADAQRASRYPEMTYWDFTFRDAADSVDCFYNPTNNELYLSGFDTDGKGTFYFAGGEPLRVSCFKGTKFQWRREVSKAGTTCALFRMHGDSLYLVQNVTHELIVLSKDGKGDVRRVKLPVDSIKDGVLHDKYFVLCSNLIKPKEWSSSYELTFFRYDGSLMLRDTVYMQLCDKYMRPAPDYFNQHKCDEHGYRLAEYINPCWDYKGLFHGVPLYVSGCRFVLNRNGADNKPLIRKIDVGINAEEYYQVIPLPVLTDITDYMCHTRLPEISILRGTHVYYPGYWHDGRLMVADFDVDKIFPTVRDEIKNFYDHIRDEIK